eukprot:CAMPEP_0206149826 /NCGR_PEP_ID=MMETSP1473-20131121/37984_1 /ASSEMBLY_ACC=CAM_ASM_001109 /TAXON_ID=1461547 /ORGANISM="Stichococcus sp, Strain RCC1054" /LENGTH=128 /DNA_ID=CAMNT_0053547309 /DNA_START=1693 /DNA_END=2079 /DNA_ORIENTATION=-
MILRMWAVSRCPLAEVELLEILHNFAAGMRVSSQAGGVAFWLLYPEVVVHARLLQLPCQCAQLGFPLHLQDHLSHAAKLAGRAVLQGVRRIPTLPQSRCGCMTTLRNNAAERPSLVAPQVSPQNNVLH